MPIHGGVTIYIDTGSEAYCNLLSGLRALVDALERTEKQPETISEDESYPDSSLTRSSSEAFSGRTPECG